MYVHIKNKSYRIKVSQRHNIKNWKHNHCTLVCSVGVFNANVLRGEHESTKQRTVHSLQEHSAELLVVYCNLDDCRLRWHRPGHGSRKASCLDGYDCCHRHRCPSYLCHRHQLHEQLGQIQGSHKTHRAHSRSAAEFQDTPGLHTRPQPGALFNVMSKYPINRWMHLGLVQLGTISPPFINCLHKPLIIRTVREFHIVDLEIR